MLCNKKIRSFDNNSRFRTNPGSWEVVEIFYPGNVSSWLFFFCLFFAKEAFTKRCFFFSNPGFFCQKFGEFLFLDVCLNLLNCLNFRMSPTTLDPMISMAKRNVTNPHPRALQKFPTEFRRMFLQTFKKGGPSRSPVREGGGSQFHSPVITGSNRKILVKEWSLHLGDIPFS